MENMSEEMATVSENPTVNPVDPTHPTVSSLEAEM